MAFVSVFQVISIVFFSLFLVGILNITFTDRENHCEMTYMFEYPQFVKIKVENNENFPQYALYAYSEGRFTERSRKMKFDGIPVLFLPGNVGSYKQVRSLASVALRKSLSGSKYQFHFDYFSVDYNDEKSALFGGVLARQSAFATHCLEAILKLYENAYPRSRYTPPSSVIVIGHSMGGIIAKSLLLKSSNRGRVNMILTLATPHEMPVINVDSYMNEFYSDIDEFWNVKNVNTTNLAPINSFWNKKILITIGGGPRDLLVPSSLTTSSHSDVQVLTTAIPGVWLSTDHLCIVWCKQLVLVLNRLLFSIVDSSTKQITEDSKLIKTLSKHYLLRSHPKNFTYYNAQADFIPDGEWHEDSRRSYTFNHIYGVNKTTYYMVRLTDLPDYEMVTFEAVDLIDQDFIFGCQAKYVYGQHRVCMNGRHLSQHSVWSPSKIGKRRIASFNLKKIHISYPHWTHVIFRVSPTHKPVKISVDIYSRGSRSVEYSAISLIDVKEIEVAKTVPNSLTYTLYISNMKMYYVTYLLHVVPINEECEKESYHTTAMMSTPWAPGHEVYHYFTETLTAPMRLRLSKESGNQNYSRPVAVNLLLDTKCVYKISVSFSLYDMLGQLSRNYATSIIPYMAAISLLVLRHWAAAMHTTKDTGGSFHSALCGPYVKPYYLLASAHLGIKMFAAIPLFQTLELSLKIGFSPSQNFFFRTLLLYLVALGLTHILGLVCWAVLIFSGQVAHRIIIRFLSAGKKRVGVKFWEWFANILEKAPGAAGMLLAAMAKSTCGAVSLAAGAAFYFFLLTKMYEDYLEHVVFKTLKKVAKKFKFGNRKKEVKSQDTNTSTNEEIAKPHDQNQVSTPSNWDELPMVGVDLVEEYQAEEVEEEKQPDSNSRTEDEFSTRSLHFHFAMFFLWCLVTLLQVPSLLTWAHNFKYSKMLDSDPSFIPGLVMSVSGAILWQIDAPKTNLKDYNILQYIIYFSAVVTVMIAPCALYRLSYILPIVFALITLHQAFGRTVPEEVAPITEDNSPDDKKPLVLEETDIQKFKDLKEKIKAEKEIEN